ncbi:unnamed protein product, partial [marine sediment metagenome]
DYNTRILFNRDIPKEEYAYGILSKDNTIQPLGEKEIDWLEVNRLSFRTDVKSILKEKMKTLVSGGSSDESSNDSESSSDDDDDIDIEDM